MGLSVIDGLSKIFVPELQEKRLLLGADFLVTRQISDELAFPIRELF
jgi:hypothetical protein